MLKTTLGSLAVLGALAGPASANCEAVIDDITKAISGQLTMAPGHRAAMMRLALNGYDQCMAGNTKDAGNIRDTLMAQLRKNLGGN